VGCVIYSYGENLTDEEACSNKKLAHEVSDALGLATIIPIKDIKNFTNKNYGKVFNLCDNDEKTGSGLYESAHKLEKQQTHFTGASSKVLKNFVDKRIWLHRVHNKIVTPANSFFHKKLTTPVILKNRYSHGSLKLTVDNILCTLPKQINADSYLEEFIEGDEYSYCEVPGLFAVSVKKEVEQNKICDFYFKWKKATDENCILVKHYAMEQIAAQIKSLFDITSYFRIDYRIKNNTIYTFDINPNCYLGCNGTLMKAARLAGYTFDQVVEKIYT